MSPDCERCVIVSEGLNITQAQSVCAYYTTATSSRLTPSDPTGGGGSNSRNSRTLAGTSGTSPTLVSDYSGALPSVSLKQAVVILSAVIIGGMLILWT
ncbi:hypothetical protein CALCODRAFT_495337 [Calocera cornea HHB12733]|uniref:Uncharacterized protein n=1 Tax=Calocera cornea HHB12733 TaxID=1353952 RepID=A0A165GHI0_9BASI|nr:hypothetical protein CALCODRAFT_495337 [Calocera cornea HHB12733]